MAYCEKLCTFENVCTVFGEEASTSATAVSSEGCLKVFEQDTADPDEVMTLLDMYAGCGGMSTGLCMGAAASNVNLVTRWAVDFDKDACESLRYNHPETEVRNMKAEDFLRLLYEWKDLCARYNLLGTDYSKTKKPTENKEEDETEEEAQRRPPDEDGEYEVERIIGTFYGINPDTDDGPAVLHFKVKWKGWGSDWDSWEPFLELRYGNVMTVLKNLLQMDTNPIYCLSLPTTAFRTTHNFACSGPARNWSSSSMRLVM
ncbi:putative DNA (cytosine-5)-methyltransferase CMT1 isoform X2 [Papaver somniferum]|nr:putative DNA (cytosine-5)-methyltransferase CMT1 isoform X2 [Papaver somniferum]